MTVSRYQPVWDRQADVLCNSGVVFSHIPLRTPATESSLRKVPAAPLPGLGGSPHLSPASILFHPSCGTAWFVAHKRIQDFQNCKSPPPPPPTPPLPPTGVANPTPTIDQQSHCLSAHLPPEILTATISAMVDTQKDVPFKTAQVESLVRSSDFWVAKYSRPELD